MSAKTRPRRRRNLLLTLLSGIGLLTLGALGCGGGHQPGVSWPATVNNLSNWLDETGECESVETRVVMMPIPQSKVDRVAPANQRFGEQASLAGIVGCGGASGYVSYFRFPSAAVRMKAVRGRDGLVSNELFCAKGPELVINDLLGYDHTADFCKRLGFPIHRPTHVFTASQKHRHALEATAAQLYAESEGFPLVNVYCEASGAPLEFECRNMVGGEAAALTLRKREGRFAIRSSTRR